MLAGYGSGSDDEADAQDVCQQEVAQQQLHPAAPIAQQQQRAQPAAKKVQLPSAAMLLDGAGAGSRCVLPAHCLSSTGVCTCLRTELLQAVAWQSIPSSAAENSGFGRAGRCKGKLPWFMSACQARSCTAALLLVWIALQQPCCCQAAIYLCDGSLAAKGFQPTESQQGACSSEARWSSQASRQHAGAAAAPWQVGHLCMLQSLAQHWHGMRMRALTRFCSSSLHG